MRSTFRSSTLSRATLSLATLSVATLALGITSAGCAFVDAAFPEEIPVPDVRVESDDALVARGKYLAENVTGCVACHSKRDFRYLSGPLVEGSELAGGDVFGPEHGFPGVIHAGNLTPTALGQWSDGEVLRAIQAGVDKDGEPLFPLMPYPAFGKLATEDAMAIVAYLRSVEGKEGAATERALDGPLEFLVRGMPAPASGPEKAPRPGDAAYPAYLTNAAGCMHCHSQDERGELIEGLSGRVDAPSSSPATAPCARPTSLPIRRPASATGPRKRSWRAFRP